MTDMVLHVDGIALHRMGEEFWVRDVDLAERLGYAVPRGIRKPIAHLIKTGELTEVICRSVTARQPVGPGGEGTREFETKEYWLNRFESLLVVMRSDAPNGIPMRRVIATVFDKVLRQYEDSQSALRRLPAHLERWFLSPTALDFEALWPDSLVREIEHLHGRAWTGGRHPYHLKSTYPAVYRLIMSTPIANKMMENNPDRDRLRHHQHITPEARPFVVAQLGIAEAIARQSANKADFWTRMERQFASGPLQLGLDAQVRGAFGTSGPPSLTPAPAK